MSLRVLYVHHCMYFCVKDKNKQNVKIYRLDYLSASDLGTIKNLPGWLVSGDGRQKPWEKVSVLTQKSDMQLYRTSQQKQFDYKLK